MARRTRPTAPAPRPTGPSTRRPAITHADGDVAHDLDVDAERDASGDLPVRLRVDAGAPSPEQEEAERALEARREPDGSLDERLDRLQAEIEEIRERLDEDDDERLHSRDIGNVGHSDVDVRP